MRASTSSAALGARWGPGEPLLRCDGLVVGYDGCALLPSISLEIEAGSFWAVIGRNGSGKTTWFKTLLRLIPPVGGRVRWPHADLRLAYVPQRTEYDLLFPATAADVVALGTERGWGFLGPRRPAAARDAAREAMRQTGTTELAGARFRDLSEGQKQRVLLARVVASAPELALLDEPTAAMDVRNEEETLALIDRLRRRYGMAVVIVSHFLGVAARFAEQVLFVDAESQSVRVGPPREVLDQVDFATEAALAKQGRETDGAGESS